MKQIPVTIAALLGIASVQGQATQSPPTSAQAPAPAAGAARQEATAVGTQKPQDQQEPAPARMSEDKRVKADAIDRLLEEGKVLVLDVREPKEIEELGGLEDALNIPIGQLERRLGELPKDRLILTA